MKRLNTVLLTLLACLSCLTRASLNAREVTFLAASDSHYREPDHKAGNHNDLNRATIEEMNRITERTWPEKLGGGKIAKPLGVVMPGDLIDDGDRGDQGRKISEEQFQLFEGDVGLDGTDGLLKYPVFEGWGNHDGPRFGQEKNGFSTRARIQERNRIRLQKQLISNLSANGLHYSWDWDDVHFIQLNLYPADRQNAKVKYSPEWHDPEDALAFLKEDLAAQVGTSGRPVVLLSHCGFDTDWWVAEDWAAVYAAAKPYNVILYIYGHSGTGVGAWAPAGEEKKWTLVNDGQMHVGFFVINITGDRLRAAYRLKSGLEFRKGADGKQQHTWTGEWEWKWILDTNITSRP